jgi:prephenate dehydrogenase
VTIVGLGLIGGSIALAARQRAGATVTGFDPDQGAGAAAQARGALDHLAASLAEAVGDAQVALLAAPVDALPGLVAEVLDLAGPDCVVSDVGSVKRAIVAANPDPRFVGGHPLAGAETAGIEQARPDLFVGATWYLTPVARTEGILYERLHRLLRSLGARPAAIDAETHDRLLAVVSHLPHVLANVLVAQAAGALGGGDERLPATGPSFRDATRVAGAPSSIWTSIYLGNRDVLVGEIDRAIERLGEIRATLAAGEPGAVSAWNDCAARDRRRLLEAGLAGGEHDALHELRASVPNRPGVVAQLALELGRAGVNIVDMALYPAPDMSEGVIALWIAGAEAAEQAQRLIAGLGFPVASA